MLEFKNINVSFNKGTVDHTDLFTDFNLKVEKGEFVSIVGSNGSGKTTLLNLVAGSVNPDSGKILLADEDMTSKREFVRARRIGRVFQSPSLGCAGNMTIAENMSIAENKISGYGLQFGLNKKKIELYKEILQPLGLGLENRINVPVCSLSGGQRQLLSLITATLTPIDLLLLDEHTAALDPVAAEETMRLTDKIVCEKGVTTLMVTHNLRFAVEYGNRLIMMDKGRIVVDVRGEEKVKLKVTDLLDTFNNISIECGN